MLQERKKRRSRRRNKAGDEPPEVADLDGDYVYLRTTVYIELLTQHTGIQKRVL